MNITVLAQQAGQRPTPYISIVIPVFNEVDTVRLLYQDLRAAMEPSGYAWEVVFVDDGSTDGSGRALREIHAEAEGVCLVQLNRNFGQTAAMVAGFDHCCGEIIIAMDGDLQNDPKDIPRLVEKLEDGYDVVSGWRANRQDGFWLRRFPSRLANWLISRTTGTYLHDYGCTLKAYRREVIRHLRLYGEMHRFIPALLGGHGARIAELPVSHHARRYGRSKYGISRTIRVLLDLLLVKFTLSFMTKPLQIFGLVGLMAFIPGTAICAYLVFARIFFNQQLADRPLFLLGMLLTMVGTQFVSMGILAEIQTRTYHESSNKPIYFVRELLEPRSPQPTGAPTAHERKAPAEREAQT
ncbi:MAG TPA: glycosyltransferase family 2 protein, partial [Candidatus Binatia bacterium]|nr:glycosyltransferase family 2 protein [Candidatus Binatia bacterium]